MPRAIEDYALIGNQETAALVARDGSIDWLGMPRFDSAAFFAALLGAPDHGRWRIAPVDGAPRVTRAYRDSSLVLETTFETPDGAVRVVDFMARRPGASDLVRIVQGLRGRVRMRTEVSVRFDYGAVVPWVSREDDGRLRFVAGPDRLHLDAAVPLRGEGLNTVAEFDVAEGEEQVFSITWTPSWTEPPEAPDTREALVEVERLWGAWGERLPQHTEAACAVCRSLLTLKALAHWQTGGIVAAATTSLPEWPGGERNWDYRYCWLRDATFTLYALLNVGFVEEADAWRGWLVRAVAGDPEDLQIMYGVAGERRLPEFELPWLPGFEGSAPVRIGNAAAGQVQLDVYGEVLDALYAARKAGLDPDPVSWALERSMAEHLATIWDQPDDGIWEVRGGRRHFVHSKVMAWVAFDRVVRSATEFGLDGPVEKWTTLRDTIHAQVCDQGYDPRRNTFVQAYGSGALDASLLLIPVVGFLPPEDPRVRGTLAAIERELLYEGLVMRYDTGRGVDGLPPGEGAFLACSFWLVDNYVLQGRMDEAQALFERLLAFRNDVGLMAEEVDPATGRMLGNFPQAFSHLSLINTATGLSSHAGTAHQRAAGSSETSGRSTRARVLPGDQAGETPSQ